MNRNEATLSVSESEFLPNLSRPISLMHIRAERSILPFPEERAQILILRTSLHIYRHESVTPLWSNKCRQSQNTLAWFINRAQMRNTTAAPLTYLSNRFIQDHILKINQQERAAPRLYSAPTFPASRLTFFLPLGEFEDLYYAVCSKIRELHADLKIRLENNFLEADAILHPYGPNFQEIQSFRASGMLELLQKSWDVLIDPPLMKALDLAVRDRKLSLAQISTLSFAHHNLDDENSSTTSRPIPPDCVVVIPPSDGVLLSSPSSDGLADFTQLPPAAIVADLCEKRNAQLKRKHEEEQELLRDPRIRCHFHSRLLSDPSSSTTEQLSMKNIAGANPSLRCRCDDACRCQFTCSGQDLKDCACQVEFVTKMLHPANRDRLSGLGLGLDLNDENVLEGGDLMGLNPIDLIENEPCLDLPSPELTRASKNLEDALSEMEQAYVDRRMYDNGLRLTAPRTPPEISRRTKSYFEVLPSPTASISHEHLIPKPLSTPTKDRSGPPPLTWSSPDSIAWQSSSSRYSNTPNDDGDPFLLMPSKPQPDHLTNDWSSCFNLNPHLSPTPSPRARITAPPPRSARQPVVIASRFVLAGPGTSRIHDRPAAAHPFDSPVDHSLSGITIEALQHVDPERLRSRIAQAYSAGAGPRRIMSADECASGRGLEAGVAAKRKRELLKGGLRSVSKAIRRMTE